MQQKLNSKVQFTASYNKTNCYQPALQQFTRHTVYYDQMTSKLFSACTDTTNTGNLLLTSS